MNQFRFVVFATGIGVAIPLLWMAIYWFVLRGNAALIYSLMSEGRFDRVLIAVWPSWLFFIADPNEQSIAIPVVSVVVNGVLYGAVGWLVWYGLNRHRFVLPVTAVGIVAGMYSVLRWYGGA